ncbi:MAG: hypothetical protein AB7N91_30950 [Candidatus Tectimicrobiota bacterium]
MDSAITPYQAAYGEGTLPIWAAEAGQQTANADLTGAPDTAVLARCRAVLSRKALGEIALLPSCSSTQTL